MNFGLVPEVFFDLIARLVPGSLFLVGAFAVHLGPTAFRKSVASALPAANLASILLFALLAYFVAIVLEQIWGFRAPTARGTAEGKEPSDLFLRIRSRMPAEASRLLKLQAEKKLCEVLIPGVVILLLGDLWMIFACPSRDLTHRIALGLVLLISCVAFWSWRRNLELLYRQRLAILQPLSEEVKAEPRNNAVPE